MFTMQQPSTAGPAVGTGAAGTGSKLKLWTGENEVTCCRKHNFNAHVPNMLMKCCVCTRTPIPVQAQSFMAIKCQSCSLGDFAHFMQCCALKQV